MKNRILAFAAAAVLGIFSVTAFGADPVQATTEEPAKEEPKRAVVHRTLVFVPQRASSLWNRLAGGMTGSIAREIPQSRRQARAARLLKQNEERNYGASVSPYAPRVMQISDTPPPAVVRPLFSFPVAKFSSSLNGAEVRVDGEFQGITPTAEIRQREGTHHVTFRKSGYLPWESDFEALAGAPINIRAELVPAPMDENKVKVFGLN